MKPIVVYYSEINNFLRYDVEPLLPYLKNNIFSNSELLRCPAFLDVVKNTVVVNSPFSIEISVKNKSNISYEDEKKQTVIFESPQHSTLKEFFQVKDETNAIISFKMPRFIFYSEESLLVESCQASFHDNEFIKNTSIIPGRFDISKHIRPLEISTKFNNNKRIQIKEGIDALIYYKFITNKNIIFKRFMFDPKNPFLTYIFPSLDIRKSESFKPKPLSFYYDLKMKYNLNGKILEYIKKHLI